MFQPNFCFATDFYKLTHWLQYPKGMNKIVSYGEARQGAIFEEILYNGMIPILKDFFEGVVVTKEKIDEAEQEAIAMGGHKSYFNRPMWEYILKEFGGKLPLEIRSLEEGTLVRPGTPLFRVTNTGDAITTPLVNHSETLLMHVWNATTVASMSHYIKQKMMKYATESGTPELVPYMLHDFGFRGVSSFQSAVYAAMGHLLSFYGTDTNEAVRAINHYYPGTTGFRGASVWATEHSVATSFGPSRGEYEYLKHQLKNAPGNAIISIVMDSYDTFNFAGVVAADPEIKASIIKRPGRVVFRPDSGDPMIVVPRLFDILGSVFGTVINNKSYKIIDNNVGVLQGDGMDYDSIPALYESIIANRWSSDNLVVGSGGGLLQKWNRDSLRMAIKACYGEINGKGFDIFKNPITANQGNETKASKRGDIVVQEFANLKHVTITSHKTPNFSSYENSLNTIFKNGEILSTRTFDDMREKANRKWGWKG